MLNLPYVLTVASEKGGVGKTTLATNLAVYLKALLEDVPVTVLSLDNHFTVDKMFAFPGRTAKGSVADLLSSGVAEGNVHDGQYGVSYVPSSGDLEPLRRHMQDVRVLSTVLAHSGLSGFVIVDTRPDLDVFTRNAIFAADQVLVPIKDMASADNCKNIFDLAGKWHIEKRSLAVVPCIVDQRIKFGGILKDQQTLLRKFVESRGYRCSRVTITKSPKVESLSTNPEGKVYPVITHARGTDIHGQFTELARDVISESAVRTGSRCSFVLREAEALKSRDQRVFLERAELAGSSCLFCGASMARPEGRAGYFYQISDGTAYGFLDDACVRSFMYQAVFGFTSDIPANDFTTQFIEETMRESVFVLAPEVGASCPTIVVRRYGLSGELISCKELDWKRMKSFLASSSFINRGNGENASLVDMLLGVNGGLRGSYIVVVPVDTCRPMSILKEPSFNRFQALCDKIAEDVASEWGIAGRIA